MSSKLRVRASRRRPKELRERPPRPLEDRPRLRRRGRLDQRRGGLPKRRLREARPSQALRDAWSRMRREPDEPRTCPRDLRALAKASRGPPTRGGRRSHPTAEASRWIAGASVPEESSRLRSSALKRFASLPPLSLVAS